MLVHCLSRYTEATVLVLGQQMKAKRLSNYQRVMERRRKHSNASAIVRGKCHVWTMVHGEFISSKLGCILYQPAVVELHGKLVTCRHLGLSKEACEHARGSWFRTPCVTLKDCIDKRPKTGSTEYSQAFENFIKDVIITDAHDHKQCQLAREGKFQLSLHSLSTVCFPHPNRCLCL